MKSIRKIATKIFLLILIVIAVIWSILVGYSVEWTGFGDFTTLSGEFVRGKTLWDWFELLVIPLSLLVGGYLLNRSERAVERQIAEDRATLEREIALDHQRETALQAYLDHMAELLLKDKLRSTRNKEVRNVARIRTLTVLRGLDSSRKGIVVKFLHEAGLIEAEKAVVWLEGAYLFGANLMNANLVGVELSGVNLEDADLLGVRLVGARLREANLDGAKMTLAHLSGADLRGAIISNATLTSIDLSGADLMGAELVLATLVGANLAYANLANAYLTNAELMSANLQGANLSGVDLVDADLSDADLRGANVTNQQLAVAHSLKGAIMPDGTIHD